MSQTRKVVTQTRKTSVKKEPETVSAIEEKMQDGDYIMNAAKELPGASTPVEEESKKKHPPQTTFDADQAK